MRYGLIWVWWRNRSRDSIERMVELWKRVVLAEIMGFCNWKDIAKDVSCKLICAIPSFCVRLNIARDEEKIWGTLEVCIFHAGLGRRGLID